MSHIQTVAMLSVLKIGQWTARKIDRAVTSKAIADANAVASAGRFNKQLLGKDALGAIATLVGAARTFHYSETLPWLDDGPRVLPTKRHEHYMTKMDEFEEQFAGLVRQFITAYPAFVTQAETELGSMFRRTDYPSPLTIERFFSWECKLLPIPDKSDFRADIGDAAIARVRSDIERQTNAAMGLAVMSVFERVHEKLTAVVEKLTAYKPGDDEKRAEGVFRDSLITNVRDLVEIMPDLNITGDKRIDALAARMASLCGHDAFTLRNSDTIRAKVATEAAQVLQTVSDFMA